MRHAQPFPDLLRESRRAVAASDGASAVGLSPAEPDVEQPASTRLESRAPETSAIVRSFIGPLFTGTAERFDASSDEAGAQNCGHDRFVFDGRQPTETDWGSVASGIRVATPFLFVVGLRKTEYVKIDGRLGTVDEVGIATLSWIHWLNDNHLLSSIGDLTPH